MSEVQFNDSLYPIITTVFPTDLTEQAVIDCNKRVLAYLRKGKHIAIVNDFAQAQMTKAMQKGSADFLEQHKNLFVSYIAGIAYVFRNPLQRAVARTYVLLYKPPVRVTMVATTADGILQARDWLRVIECK